MVGTFFELLGDIISGTGRVISAIYEAVEILKNDDWKRGDKNGWKNRYRHMHSCNNSMQSYQVSPWWLISERRNYYEFFQKRNQTGTYSLNERRYAKWTWLLKLPKL